MTTMTDALTISPEEFEEADYYRQIWFDIPRSANNAALIAVVSTLQMALDDTSPPPFSQPPDTYPPRTLHIKILQIMQQVLSDDDAMMAAHADTVYGLDGLHEYWVLGPRLHQVSPSTRPSTSLARRESQSHTLTRYAAMSGSRHTSRCRRSVISSRRRSTDHSSTTNPRSG